MMWLRRFKNKRWVFSKPPKKKKALRLVSGWALEVCQVQDGAAQILICAPLQRLARCQRDSREVFAFRTSQTRNKWQLSHTLLDKTRLLDQGVQSGIRLATVCWAIIRFYPSIFDKTLVFAIVEVILYRRVGLRVCSRASGHLPGPLRWKSLSSRVQFWDALVSELTAGNMFVSGTHLPCQNTHPRQWDMKAYCC